MLDFRVIVPDPMEEFYIDDEGELMPAGLHQTVIVRDTDLSSQTKIQARLKDFEGVPLHEVVRQLTIKAIKIHKEQKIKSKPHEKRD